MGSQISRKTKKKNFCLLLKKNFWSLTILLNFDLTKNFDFSGLRSWLNDLRWSTLQNFDFTISAKKNSAFRVAIATLKSQSLQHFFKRRNSPGRNDAKLEPANSLHASSQHIKQGFHFFYILSHYVFIRNKEPDNSTEQPVEVWTVESLVQERISTNKIYKNLRIFFASCNWWEFMRWFFLQKRYSNLRVCRRWMRYHSFQWWGTENKSTTIKRRLKYPRERKANTSFFKNHKHMTSVQLEPSSVAAASKKYFPRAIVSAWWLVASNK